jgi:hypothetical protein
MEGQPMNLCGPMRKHLLKVAAIALLVLPAFAQSPPKYDPATETKVKGTVEEMKLVSATGGAPTAYLAIKMGEEKVQVYLCPKSFLDEMGVSFSPGDEVEVTGSKVKQDGADLILAREVVKGGDTLTLRFPDGKPAW